MTMIEAAGEAGVVDQHVKSAELRLDVLEQGIQVGRLADVPDAAGDPGCTAGNLRDGFGIDVRDMHAGTVGHEGLGDSKADPAAPR
jgi:hypothetical protein